MLNTLATVTLIQAGETYVFDLNISLRLIRYNFSIDLDGVLFCAKLGDSGKGQFGVESSNQRDSQQSSRGCFPFRRHFIQ
jgi:hypothetical protein